MPQSMTLINDVSLVLAGEAGQGIATVEQILLKVFRAEGWQVAASKEYMSRVRGGSNTTQIRVASFSPAAYRERIDVLVALDSKALEHVRSRLSAATLIIVDEGLEDAGREHIIPVPFTRIARELGRPVLSNSVAVGVVAALFGVALESLLRQVSQAFARKDPGIAELNCSAARRGFEMGRKASDRDGIVINIPREPTATDHLLLNGHEAAGLGAVVGGCNFIASYPMSPSTGVLTFLAQHALEFGIVVEQAEDEIAAVNMALGSWYAGGRAMVTTSGGGFALMTEGLSLAGAIESPLVVHLAQRPGPATGLPTRTEQGDLDLALYAGHGDFPRAIFTPGTLEDVYLLTAAAFEVADRFQVPAIILTDQWLLDSYQTLKSLPSANVNPYNHVVQTKAGYRRYQLTASGISPRGIPGWGEGLVQVDSDEHDESGQITESAAVRRAMVEKRLRKGDMLKEAVLPLQLIGSPDFKRLVLGWGSTYHPICEALQLQKDPQTAFLYFRQVVPFPSQAISLIGKAREIISVENNAVGQLAGLLRRETGIAVHRRILQYDGAAFSAEGLARQL